MNLATLGTDWQEAEHDQRTLLVLFYVCIVNLRGHPRPRDRPQHLARRPQPAAAVAERHARRRGL